MSASDQSSSVSPAAAPHARRDQDIALDLLKFVAGSTNILRTATSSTGFTAASAPRPEDQVTMLLDLYSRCLATVSNE